MIISTERVEHFNTCYLLACYKIESSSNELLDKYKFDLYKGSSQDLSDLIESSGWIQHNGSINNTDTHRFKTVLTNSEDYTVVYSIITVNGYEGEILLV